MKMKMRSRRGQTTMDSLHRCTLRERSVSSGVDRAAARLSVYYRYCAKQIQIPIVILLLSPHFPTRLDSALIHHLKVANVSPTHHLFES
jgi:hypothetical protein